MGRGKDGGRRIRARTGEEWVLIASEEMRRNVEKRSDEMEDEGELRRCL